MSAVAAPTPARETIAPARFGSTLTGTGTLLRFMLRRDRMRIFWWVLGITALYAGGLDEYRGLDDDPVAAAARADLVQLPAMVFATGPGYGIEDYRTGVAIANEFILWLVLTLGVMSILQVVRHTRAEEESSRSELVRAGVVGRHASSVAALLLVGLMNVVVAVASALALVAQGLDAGQSFAMTVAIGAGALVFGAVALVAAQVTEHGRGAVGIGLAALGAAWMFRAIGDMQELHGSWVSWLSPIAWVQQTRVFVDLRWWPVGLCLVAVVLLVALAGVLASRRDFGAGLVAVRKGRADATPTLRGPLAVAWIQQRAALLWTAGGLALLWAGTGTILREVPSMMEATRDSAVYDAIIGQGDPLLAFVGVFGLYIATAAGAYGVAAVSRLKGEEESGRTELTLSAPVARARHLAASVLLALLGAAFVQVTGALGLWFGATASGYDDLPTRTYLELGSAYLPAVAVLVGLGAALYAWLPRFTGLAWALVGYVFVVGMFADLFGLPDWARRISPFWWVGNPALEDVAAARLWALGAVAVALLALAFVGFRRRDVPRV